MGAQLGTGDVQHSITHSVQERRARRPGFLAPARLQLYDETALATDMLDEEWTDLAMANEAMRTQASGLQHSRKCLMRRLRRAARVRSFPEHSGKHARSLAAVHARDHADIWSILEKYRP